MALYFNLNFYVQALGLLSSRNGLSWSQ